MSPNFVNTIIDAISEVTGGRSVLHEPVFNGNEIDYVTDCIRTGWVSSVGSYVDRVEQELAEFTGARFAIATVNGTAALHTALTLVDVGPQDEVIVPALSFVATANAVTYCGAVPHFADACERTLGLDPTKLRQHLEQVLERTNHGWRNLQTGRRVAAIVPMHTFGHPCDIAGICEVATQFNLPIIEDAAESLGSYSDSQHTGTFGKLGILSFNGNKIVTAGGGGAILTNDAALAKRAKHVTTTAKIPHRWNYDHDTRGFNYRMPNLNAALACAQLEQLDTFIRVKREIAQHYCQVFKQVDGVEFIQEPETCRSNYWLNAIRVNEATRQVRDSILEATNTLGLMTRPCWTPLNQLPMFQTSPSADLSTTSLLSNQLINLPSGAGLRLSTT